jgi:DNA-binding SARP family transcriptional activator
VAQRRRLGLLALLGAAGEKGLSRDKLAGHLWPETDESSAKHRLSDSLHVLRKELGEDALLTSGEFLRLNPALVECDVQAFEAALEGKRFEEALSVYAGPFLDGFYLGGEGEFDAYTRYLNLRTDPDPELLPQVDSVRMALAGLVEAGK